MKKKKFKANRRRNLMRLLICGDRNWIDGEFIRNILLDIGPENIEVVIEGGARGADTLARKAAQSLEIKVEEYPADWEFFGKPAGHIRNIQMLLEGRPTDVLAFHDDFENSKGTKDMIQRARKAGLTTTIISHTTTTNKK